MHEAAGLAADAAEKLGHRQSVFVIAAFLVVGLALLFWVNEKEGRKVALGEVPAGSGD